MTRHIYLALIMTLLSTSAHAYFYDGNHLSKLMAEHQKAIRKDSTTDYSDAWAFRGYVIGVHDTVGHFGLYCAPGNLGERQIASIVASFMENNPASWSNPGSDIVIAAMKESFPCSK
jgi:hypothetical protein